MFDLFERCFSGEREREREIRMSTTDDHNGAEGKQPSGVQKVGDVSALYYREKETGDSTRPTQREVAIEDQWDTQV